MNTDKISKFISQKRKEKNLTQQELAKITHLSEKTISKWECGRGIPDIGNLQSLSKALDVSVTELLNGEEEQKEKPVIDYIEYKEKKNNNKIILTIVGAILLILISILGMYFINNYGKTTVTLLEGKGTHFFYNNMLITKSNEGIILSNGFLTNDFEYDYEVYALELYYKDQKIKELYNRPGAVIEKRDGKNEIIEKAANDLDNWEIRIKYTNKTKKENGEEIIHLSPEKIVEGKSFKKDKLLSLEELVQKKTGKSTEELEKDSIKRNKDFIEFLKNNGFEIETPEENLIFADKTIKEGSINVEITKSNEFFRPGISVDFKYKNESYHVSFIKPFTKYNKQYIVSDKVQFDYLINQNEIVCKSEKCPKDLELEEVGKLYVKIIEENFYDYDLFDREEKYDNYINQHEEVEIEYYN